MIFIVLVGDETVDCLFLLFIKLNIINHLRTFIKARIGHLNVIVNWSGNFIKNCVLFKGLSGGNVLATIKAFILKNFLIL